MKKAIRIFICLLPLAAIWGTWPLLDWLFDKSNGVEDAKSITYYVWYGKFPSQD